MFLPQINHPILFIRNGKKESARLPPSLRIRFLNTTQIGIIPNGIFPRYC